MVAVHFYKEMENQEKWRRFIQCSLEHIADQERRLYGMFGLGRLPAHTSKWITLAMNVYGGKLASGVEVFSETEPGDIYQAGGDVIVTREGEVVYSFRGPAPFLRPPVEELLTALEKHKQ